MFRSAASIAADDSAGGIGGLLLTFARDCAPLIARREEYDPDAFERLIGIAERAGKPLGEYLIEIARATNFDLLEYRIKLRAMLDYTSPGYIFHPIEIDDGRIADNCDRFGLRRQRRSEDRFAPAGIRDGAAAVARRVIARLNFARFDRAGQIGYYAECILGGLHGLDVGDLAAGLDADAGCARELADHLGPIARGERERFFEATSLDAVRYGERFSNRRPPSIATFLKMAGVV